jgi:hypothetical protein
MKYKAMQMQQLLTHLAQIRLNVQAAATEQAKIAVIEQEMNDSYALLMHLLGIVNRIRAQPMQQPQQALSVATELQEMTDNIQKLERTFAILQLLLQEIKNRPAAPSASSSTGATDAVLQARIQELEAELLSCKEKASKENKTQNIQKEENASKGNKELSIEGIYKQYTENEVTALKTIKQMFYPTEEDLPRFIDIIKIRESNNEEWVSNMHAAWKTKDDEKGGHVREQTLLKLVGGKFHKSNPGTTEEKFAYARELNNIFGVPESIVEKAAFSIYTPHVIEKGFGKGFELRIVGSKGFRGYTEQRWVSMFNPEIGNAASETKTRTADIVARLIRESLYFKNHRDAVDQNLLINVNVLFSRLNKISIDGVIARNIPFDQLNDEFELLENVYQLLYKAENQPNKAFVDLLAENADNEYLNASSNTLDRFLYAYVKSREDLSDVMSETTFLLSPFEYELAKTEENVRAHIEMIGFVRDQQPLLRSLRETVDEEFESEFINFGIKKLNAPKDRKGKINFTYRQGNYNIRFANHIVDKISTKTPPFGRADVRTFLQTSDRIVKSLSQPVVNVAEYKTKISDYIVKYNRNGSIRDILQRAMSQIEEIEKLQRQLQTAGKLGTILEEGDGEIDQLLFVVDKVLKPLVNSKNRFGRSNKKYNRRRRL